MTYDYDQLVDSVATRIEDLRLDLAATAVVGLATGGFVVARHLSKRLRIPSANVFGLTVIKTVTAPVDYLLSPRVTLDLSGMNAFIVDDSSNRGRLLEAARARSTADKTWTVALVANLHGAIPDIVGAFHDGTPPALGV